MSVTEADMDAVRAAMRGIRAAGAYDQVYNDECVLSFDTPFSPGGLYVSLANYRGFGKEYVAVDLARGSGKGLYVHLKWTKVEKEKPTDAAAPTKMAIGGEAGFQVDDDKFDVIKENAVVVLGGPVRRTARPRAATASRPRLPALPTSPPRLPAVTHPPPRRAAPAAGRASLAAPSRRATARPAALKRRCASRCRAPCCPSW